MVGHVDFDAAMVNGSWITPAPGGVGPPTIAMLLSNALEAAQWQHEQGEARSG